MGQVSPAAAVSQLVEQGVHHFAQVVLAGATCAPVDGFGEPLLQGLPLSVGQVRGVRLAFHNFSVLDQRRLFQHTLSVVKAVGQGISNNAQPVQAVPAAVVAKRINTWGSSSANTGGSVNTSYYVTFEMADGERQELGMGGRDYGLLVEGDRGTLSFQGTRYKGFDRSRA